MADYVNMLGVAKNKVPFVRLDGLSRDLIFVLTRLMQTCMTATLEARMAAGVLQTQVRYKMTNKGRRIKEHVSSSSTKKMKYNLHSKKTVQIKDVVADDPEFLARVPEDDVYFQKYYPIPSYLFEEAITLHREYADPMMHDNMSGMVYTDLSLDMSTKKKTRQKPNFKGLLHFPHHFDTKKSNRCIVVCGKDEETSEALDNGAIFAGGLELIKDLQPKVGSISRSEFDFLLCTPEMIEPLLPIRSALKEVFPSVEKGSIGTDVAQMLSKFQSGYLYSSSRDGVIGNVQAPIGMLDMPLEQLLENFQKLITEINNREKTSKGSFVIGIKILVPPSPEEFKLRIDEFLEG